MARNLMVSAVIFRLAAALCTLGISDSLGANGIDDYLIETEAELLDNGADYLIIGHDSLTEALLPLADLRSAHGLVVRIAEITLIYATFQDGGEKRCDAIKDFTQRVHDFWDPVPTYLLLFGDASDDGGDNDLVPSKKFPKFSYPYCFGLTGHASDNWYVQLDGPDYLPDMIVGRLPVRSSSEAELIIGKIVEYEATSNKAIWQSTVLTVASDDTEDTCDVLIDEFIAPAGYAVTNVYASDCSSPECRAAVVDAIDAGCAVVLAMTHGNHLNGTWWSNPPPPGKILFDDSDIQLLDNVSYPVIFGQG